MGLCVWLEWELLASEDNVVEAALTGVGREEEDDGAGEGFGIKREKADLVAFALLCELPDDGLLCCWE